MEVYEGMIIGEHSRDTDLEVNPVREKKLTNVRNTGSEERVTLTPARSVQLCERRLVVKDIWCCLVCALSTVHAGSSLSRTPLATLLLMSSLRSHLTQPSGCGSAFWTAASANQIARPQQLRHRSQ